MLRLVALIGLLLLVALPLRGALDVGFLQDDYNATEALGPELTIDGPTVLRLVSPPPDEQDARLRPIAYLTLLLDIRFFGLDPVALHLSTLLYHLAATALVFALARTLWPAARAFPWLAALFFGLNPVHADAIGWLAARADPVAGVLSLAALLAYARHRLSGRRRAGLLCWILYAAALLSKESAVVTPGLALLLEPALAGRTRRRGVLPVLLGLGALTAAYLAYRHHLFGVFLGTYGGHDTAVWSIGLADVRHGLRVFLSSASRPWLAEILALGPAVFAVLCLLGRNRSASVRAATRAALLFVVAILIAALPVMPVLTQTDGRHYYLVAAPLAGGLAAMAAHPCLRRRAARATIAVWVGVFGLLSAAGQVSEMSRYVEAGRITAAVQRDLGALRAAHPEVRNFVVGDLRGSWRRAPLLRFGFSGLARPPFQPVPVPVIGRFRGEARDLRWEAYTVPGPSLFLRMRVPPETPGLEPISAVLRDGPPRDERSARFELLAPTGGAGVHAGPDTVFRFRESRDRPAGRPLRLVIRFPGGAPVAWLLGPENLEEQPARPDGARILVWRPRQGILRGTLAPARFRVPAEAIPAVWWIEEADLDHPAIRAAPSSRAARFRLQP